ncbi:hypothetical protein N9174_02335 [bacterium]|nr:hypothetical protein [bacterium]
MKRFGRCVVALAGFLVLYNLSISFSFAASDGALMHYKPQPRPLKYNLSITTKSQASALFNPGPLDEQEDVISISQRSEKAGVGLLDLTLTVEGINRELEKPNARELYLTPRGGSGYKRKDILGNTGHTLINLLGGVKEARGIPHFGSVYFHSESLVGPPLGIYPILTMIHPQFPLKLLKEGDAWEVNDEIEIGSAEAIPIGGLGTLKHELSMTVKREMVYTLIGYVEKGRRKTAHIGFKGTFSMEGEMITESGGDFIEGTGRSSGEFYFVPAEGLLVEALIKSEVNEEISKHGNVVHWFNPDVGMGVFFGQRTAPITWLTQRDLHFVLVDKGGG